MILLLFQGSTDGLVDSGDAFEQIAAHEKEVERDDEPLPIEVDDGQFMISLLHRVSMSLANPSFCSVVCCAVIPPTVSCNKERMVLLIHPVWPCACFSLFLTCCVIKS